MFNSKKITSTILILIASSLSYATPFSDRQDVQDFMHAIAKKHNIDYDKLHAAFSNYESSEDIINKISKPFEEVSWYNYRALFLTKKRIQGGKEFWKKYEKVLNKAQQEFGVPAEIIVSIIGVETFYGAYTGTYPVLQALSTLAFDYPRRAKFFSQELEEFIVLSFEENLPIAKIKGSYAGAMGTPQFIPSSYRNYAIDFTKTGKKDLINSVPDAIGSVANYLKSHGWKTEKNIAQKAKITGKKYQSLKIASKNSPKPIIELSTLKQHGVYPTSEASLSNNSKLALLELGKDDKKEYWLGEDNFYVITRYNHSVNYAMAVYQLSQEILKAVK